MGGANTRLIFFFPSTFCSIAIDWTEKLVVKEFLCTFSLLSAPNCTFCIETKLFWMDFLLREPTWWHHSFISHEKHSPLLSASAFTGSPNQEYAIAIATFAASGGQTPSWPFLLATRQWYRTDSTRSSPVASPRREAKLFCWGHPCRWKRESCETTTTLFSAPKHGKP